MSEILSKQYMLITDTKAPELPYEFVTKKRVSLSTYFPNGTKYFYGYPAGQASGFLNKVGPIVEELVAARSVSCAGHAVSVIKFAATSGELVGQDLLDKLGVPQLPNHQVTLLPREIDANLKGDERNEAIKKALLESVAPGSLVMAQPYTDEKMKNLYKISPELCTWVNDKNNMEKYISDYLLPKRFGLFSSGDEFIANHHKMPLPCVVKVSSSSAGDGVHICQTKQDMQKAVKELNHITGTILVEQFIKAKKNFGLHFGIPFDKRKPIDLIGVNEQLTTSEGEFIGGIIKESGLPPELLPIEQYLLTEILPAVREKGWYGIGCFDVLCDERNRLYIIDSNFRITGMSAYHLLISNGTIKSPLMSFSAEFTGSREEFEQSLIPYAGVGEPLKMVQLIALTNYGKHWNFNGSLFFSSEEELKQRAQTLIDLGVKSQALSQLVNS